MDEIYFMDMRTKLSLNSELPVDPSRILDTLVNNLDGMVYRCRLDDEWTMLFVSQGCLNLTGYAPQDLIGNSIVSYESITHFEDRERIRAEIGMAVSMGSRFSVRYRIYTKSGILKWVHERGAGVQDENGELVLEGFIEDETMNRETMEALRNAEHYYRNLVENASIGIFQTTIDGHYLSANPALARIYGYSSPEELIRALSDIGRQLYVDGNRREEFRHQMQLHGEVANFESEVYRKDASKIWISENAHMVRNVNGDLVCYEGTVHDITERKLHQTLLERQANYDVLTGLLNRNLLHKMLEQSISRAGRLGYFLAVVFVDLDNFKFINDSLGHAAGDSLLVEVATRLKECLRSSDTVVRQGGDEFVLVLNDHYRIGSIVTLLQRVLNEIGRPIMLSGREFQVGASLGTAIYPQDGNDAQSLLKHADAAMYAAKNKGRNNFQFYTSELNRVADERLNIENALRIAIEQDELDVFFQPKVDSKRRILGLEALARWSSAEWGNVSPERFIPIAEETGLIIPLTELVLQKAFAATSKWNERLNSPLKIAVNLSPRLFLDREIVRRIERQMTAADLPAFSVELEITESVFMGDSEKTLSILHELKSLGFTLAMDDFGTGYSSLGYLRRFPLDIIKMDRSLVTGIEHEEEVAKIARAVISLGKSLGKTVVAEGVENEAQFQFLEGQGCHEFQGYLISKPLSGKELSLMLFRSAHP
jgi:diguanylate cyclase (GGDEF)-like protein/PAS domain S-box-containing protein